MNEALDEMRVNEDEREETRVEESTNKWNKMKKKMIMQNNLNYLIENLNSNFHYVDKNIFYLNHEYK